jgi:TolA-binding protein
MSLEIIELRRGLEQKKQGDLAGAIVTLEHYRQTNRQGTFLFEASLAEAQAELELGRRKEAAQTLDALGDDPRSPRAEELGILRAELWSQTGRCKDALPVFARSQETPGLAERALYGHARCLETLGDFTTSREEFKRYLDRFPSGVFSAEVVRALGL